MMALRLAMALVAMADIGLLGWLGVAEALGAHPSWAVTVSVIGGALGGGFGVALIGLGLWRAVGAALALVSVSGWASWNGKMAFVASFAEDAAAGQAWYFGAIGVAAGLAALEVLLIWVLVARHFDQAKPR